MAFVNYTTKSIAIKIVYYGPGLSGKTTNLRYIYSKLDDGSRGDLLCLETPIERTLFFDLLPIKAGMIHDFRIHFQLMTVPGQVFYGASRKSVLKGADGIVFVADSQVPLLDANLENFDGLRKNLLEFNIDLNFIPLVFQYNKRDLDNLIPIETFNSLLNPQKLPYVEACAINGIGVFETLKEIAKLTVPYVKEKVFAGKTEPVPEAVEEEQPVPKVTETVAPAAVAEVEPLAPPAAAEPPAQPAETKPAETAAAPESAAVPESFAEDVTPKERDTVDFSSDHPDAPIRMTKIKFKSPADVEEEMEKLAREFGSKS